MLADGNQSATHDLFCGNMDAMMLSFPGLLAKAYLTQQKYILFYLLLTPLWTYVYFLDNALSISIWKHANIQMLCFLSFFIFFKFLHSKSRQTNYFKNKAQASEARPDSQNSCFMAKQQILRVKAFIIPQRFRSIIN